MSSYYVTELHKAKLVKESCSIKSIILQEEYNKTITVAYIYSLLTHIVANHESHL